MDATALVEFRNAPFPYSGAIPEQNRPFLEADPDGRLFHLSPRAGKLYEETYADRRSLLSLPARFDPARPGAALVLFLHGNLATLADVAGRQRVPQQLLASHFDAALVAPQLAVDALDSSAGRFWEPGFLAIYLEEAAQHLATLAHHRFSAAAIDRLPVVIVAYSGGYLPAAFSLKYAGPGSRIRGVILLDALFGEDAKFEDWIVRSHTDAFFVSAFSKASAESNERLAAALRTQGITVAEGVPARIAPGTIDFVPALDAVHNDFVTAAWMRDPLAGLFGRIRLAG